mgnify:CR=1 FL=1
MFGGGEYLVNIVSPVGGRTAQKRVAGGRAMAQDCILGHVLAEQTASYLYLSRAGPLHASVWREGGGGVV